jgi:hypothetical protein
MAAPVYQAKGTLGETSTNTVSFTYPALAANDLLYLMVYNQGYTTITPNASWTLQNTIRTSNGFGLINLYAKVATGSESGSENVTRAVGSVDTFAAQVYSFRGDAFITIESKVSAKGASDTITWNAISVSGTERVLGAFVVNINGPNPGTPATYTNRASDVLTDGTYFELHTKDNVSSDGSVTATGGSLDEWGTFHHSIFNNTPAITTPSTFIVN